MLVPFLFASFLWWASTGAILRLIRREPKTFKATAIVVSILAVAAMVALVALRDQTGVWAAYAGFGVGLMLWAWHETMFLIGFISGSRRTPCPPNLSTKSRFIASAQTIIHHEMVIAFHAAVIFLLSMGAENQFAVLTFLLLWVMRLSAKFVVFFGAPNISDVFLPTHLQYLSSYFNRNRNSLFFGFALVLAMGWTAIAAFNALHNPAYSFEFVGFTLLVSLSGLAVIEHLALVLPLPDAALWSWMIKQPQKTPEATIGAEWRRV